MGDVSAHALRKQAALAASWRNKIPYDPGRGDLGYVAPVLGIGVGARGFIVGKRGTATGMHGLGDCVVGCGLCTELPVVCLANKKPIFAIAKGASGRIMKNVRRNFDILESCMIVASRDTERE